jgi:hypothetical protein
MPKAKRKTSTEKAKRKTSVEKADERRAKDVKF